MIIEVISLGTLLLLLLHQNITKTRLFKYIENFTINKKENFQIKKSDIFHISAQT